MCMEMDTILSYYRTTPFQRKSFYLCLLLIQVWDSRSGLELFTLEGGTHSAVTYCCFKPTGSSIVGVSDTIIKVLLIFQ